MSFGVTGHAGEITERFRNIVPIGGVVTGERVLHQSNKLCLVIGEHEYMWNSTHDDEKTKKENDDLTMMMMIHFEFFLFFVETKRYMERYGIIM